MAYRKKHETKTKSSKAGISCPSMSSMLNDTRQVHLPPRHTHDVWGPLAIEAQGLWVPMVNYLRICEINKFSLLI